METFSALLAICAGNSPVPGEFPTQRPMTRSFDVFFDLCLNKQLSKEWQGWWFETLSCSLWRHRNGTTNKGFKRDTTGHTVAISTRNQRSLGIHPTRWRLYRCCTKITVSKFSQNGKFWYFIVLRSSCEMYPSYTGEVIVPSRFHQTDAQGETKIPFSTSSSEVRNDKALFICTRHSFIQLWDIYHR